MENCWYKGKEVTSRSDYDREMKLSSRLTLYLAFHRSVNRQTFPLKIYKKQLNDKLTSLPGNICYKYCYASAAYMKYERFIKVGLIQCDFYSAEMIAAEIFWGTTILDLNKCMHDEMQWDVNF